MQAEVLRQRREVYTLDTLVTISISSKHTGWSKRTGWTFLKPLYQVDNYAVVSILESTLAPLAQSRCTHVAMDYWKRMIIYHLRYNEYACSIIYTRFWFVWTYSRCDSVYRLCESSTRSFVAAKPGGIACYVVVWLWSHCLYISQEVIVESLDHPSP